LKRPIVFVALLVVVAAAGGAVWYYKHKHEAAPAATAAVNVVYVPVSVSEVQVARMVNRVTSFGNLVPQRTVNIVPNEAGQLIKILFKDGQTVETGTALAIMDNRIAQAQVQSSQAQYEADVLNLKRTESLANRSLDSTRNLEQAQSKAAVSQADLLINQRKLDALTLRAPFPGTLGAHNVDEGAYISGSQTIVRLDDTSQFEIEFRMPATIAPMMKDGMHIHVRLPGRGDDEMDSVGKLSFIDPVVSTDSRSVLLRALVPNDKGMLRPGLFVHVRLDLDAHDNALVVPVSAVLLELSGSYVFVVDDKNIAKRRLVETNLSDDKMIEINSGLKKGERVVTVGQFRLSDGDTVKIVPAPDAGQAGN
jgi:membrane fusion protein (multidrug efflux system)